MLTIYNRQTARVTWAHIFKNLIGRESGTYWVADCAYLLRVKKELSPPSVGEKKIQIAIFKDPYFISFNAVDELRS